MTFDAKPYVIAEVGSNFRTLEDCLKSIEAAKDVGANAAKFQLYTYDAMYPLPRSITAPGEIKRLKDEINRFAVSEAWLPALAEKCADVGIDFGCTAFSPDLVRAVDPWVKWHKVASSDAAWPQLLEAVAACKKPVLLSTGAKTDKEVIRASHLLATKVPLVRLVCVAAYPADFVNLDPFVTGATNLGLSDHSLGYSVPVKAALNGACVIEKHFTAFPEMDTPDRPHSLTPVQFTAMMKLIRTGEIPDQERDMRLRHNRRLIATRDITTGVVLRYGENYGAYRSLVDDTRGASPFDWDKVDGKVAKGAIARGAAIALEDVE